MMDDAKIYEDTESQTSGEEKQSCGVCGNKIKVKDSYPLYIKKKNITLTVCKTCKGE